MTDLAAIRSRAEAAANKYQYFGTPHAHDTLDLSDDALALLDAVEERDRTIETLTEALREARKVVLSTPGHALRDLKNIEAALASVPQPDRGATDG